MAFCAEGDTEVNACFKYTILFGTFIHWLIAVGLIGVGAWALEERNKYFDVPIDDFYDILFNVSIMMIFAGCIMLIINTCGFVGALRENTILLSIFYIALLVIFLIELVGVIVAFAFKDQVLNLFGKALQEEYVAEYQDDIDGIMDYFQETYKCCGVNDYTDWNMNPYFNCTAENESPIRCIVPYTCCKTPDEYTPGLINFFCGGGALDNTTNTVEKINAKGCLPTLTDLAEDNLPLIGGVCIAIAIPQLVGIVMGRLLVNQIHAQRRAWKSSGGGSNNVTHWYDRRGRGRERDPKARNAISTFMDKFKLPWGSNDDKPRRSGSVGRDRDRSRYDRRGRGRDRDPTGRNAISTFMDKFKLPWGSNEDKPRRSRSVGRDRGSSGGYRSRSGGYDSGDYRSGGRRSDDPRSRSGGYNSDGYRSGGGYRSRY